MGFTRRRVRTLQIALALVSVALSLACVALDENTCDQPIECLNLCGAIGCACANTLPACIEATPTLAQQTCQACQTCGLAVVVCAGTATCLAGGGAGCVTGACTRCVEGPDPPADAREVARAELPPKEAVANYDEPSSEMEY